MPIEALTLALVSALCVVITHPVYVKGRVPNAFQRKRAI